jgi:hypothetical protein
MQKKFLTPYEAVLLTGAITARKQRLLILCFDVVFARVNVAYNHLFLPLQKRPFL